MYELELKKKKKGVGGGTRGFADRENKERVKITTMKVRGGGSYSRGGESL